MKTFNLEDALAGAQLITRGRYLVISQLKENPWFNEGMSEFPYCVYLWDECEPFSFTAEGEYIQGEESIYDLFMLETEDHHENI